MKTLFELLNKYPYDIEIILTRDNDAAFVMVAILRDDEMKFKFKYNMVIDYQAAMNEDEYVKFVAEQCIKEVVKAYNEA